MIKIGKYTIDIDDLLLFAYFAIMYAHNLPYPRFFTICSIVLTAYAFLKLISRGRIILNSSRFSILYWYFIFVLYELIVSLINGIFQTLIWNNVLQNFMLLFIMCQYVNSKDRFFKSMKIFAFAALYFGMVAWITSPISTYGTTEFAGITESQRNTIAYIVGIGSTIFAYFGIQEKKKRYYLFAVLCVIVTVLTGSRKGLIQLVIPILIFLIFQESGKKKVKVLATILIIGTIVVFICANSSFFMDTYVTRFLQMFEADTEDASTIARADLAALGMSLFTQNPIFGYGLGASWSLAEKSGFYNVNYFHHNYIETLVCGGIVGFVIYHWKFVVSAVTAWKNRKHNKFAILLISLITIYFVLAMGQVTIYYATFYPIFFFILQGVKYVSQTSDMPNAVGSELKEYNKA